MIICAVEASLVGEGELKACISPFASGNSFTSQVLLQVTCQCFLRINPSYSSSKSTVKKSKWTLFITTGKGVQAESSALRTPEGKRKKKEMLPEDTGRWSILGVHVERQQIKVKMKSQKTMQQFFHSKASKTNQGDERIKNREYINMSFEGSSGVLTSDQPDAQIQLPTEETVSPKPKGSSRCLSVRVTKDGYWCTSCKKADKERKLSNAIIGCKLILAIVLEMQSLSCSSKDSSQPSPDKNKEMLLGYPTRRRSCAFVNTPSPCVNKAINHIQELEIKIESSFQQHDRTLEKEKMPWISDMDSTEYSEDTWLSNSSKLDVKDIGIYYEEVIELIKRLEAERKEAEEALKREKQRKKKLAMKIDCMSIWRLQQFPIAVQKEHEICTQDFSELQWHFDCANRQLQQVKVQILKTEAVNGRIQEDIDFVKKYSPLLEEKLNLEGDAMKAVLLAHGKASKLYYDVYREVLRIQQVLKQVTEEAEKERKSMAEKIKYAEIVLKQYQNDLKHSEFLWTELCIKLKETEEKIIKEERHLEELVKQKEEIQEDAKSWNNKVQDLNNKTLAQENENKSLLDACSEVIKVIEDSKTSWESERLNMKKMLLNTLQAVDELERENKELERENEEYVQKSRESSRKKIAYQSELQIICKNTRKIEEQIRKVNKELYNIEIAYGEGKIKLEELEEKIIREKIRYKNLEENIKKLIREERGTWQLTQARIKAMYNELEQKKKDSIKTKEETMKRIADIEGPVAELEAQFIEYKNIRKENIEKLYNLNQKMQKLDEQKKQAEQQLEHKKSYMMNQLADIQGKYSDVSCRLDETIHIIENFQNRIHELNELAETKQRQIETTEKSLIELRENFSAVSCKQEKNQMIIDYLQNELEKYEKRIQHEEKTYGELLWTRQKNLEDMKTLL
ncbi:unnamed protein product [Caretta caretta]